MRSRNLQPAGPRGPGRCRRPRGRRGSGAEGHPPPTAPVAAGRPVERVAGRGAVSLAPQRSRVRGELLLLHESVSGGGKGWGVSHESAQEVRVTCFPATAPPLPRPGKSWDPWWKRGPQDCQGEALQRRMYVRCVRATGSPAPAPTPGWVGVTTRPLPGPRDCAGEAAPLLPGVRGAGGADIARLPSSSASACASWCWSRKEWEEGRVTQTRQSAAHFPPPPSHTQPGASTPHAPSPSAPQNPPSPKRGVRS